MTTQLLLVLTLVLSFLARAHTPPSLKDEDIPDPFDCAFKEVQTAKGNR